MNHFSQSTEWKQPNRFQNHSSASIRLLSLFAGLFRDKQADRDVHDYYSGTLEYENGVFVNIIHSWVAPTKFNEEYTRLIGTKGGD